jgi:type IV pilus assembly protein PilC
MINASKWVAGTSSKDQVVPGAIWVLCSPVILFLFFKLIRKTGPGKAYTDILALKIPVMGTLLKKTAVARFTRTLGTLISAGVPILEAILITRDTSGNYVFERALGKVHDSIREGETFATPLREAKVVDALVVNMIDVGEETGDLDVMLMKIADNYDEEVDVAVASLLSLLEPFMVVILGGIVLIIVLALFLPLVSMIESVSNTSKK